MNNKGQIYPIPITIKKLRWDKKEKFYLEKVIVFIGKVPKNIQTELTAFEKNFKTAYTNSKLDSHFGKGFVKNITGTLSIDGGSPISINDIGVFETNNLSNSKIQNATDENLSKTLSENEFILPGMDELNTEDVIDLEDKHEALDDADNATSNNATSDNATSNNATSNNATSDNISIHDILMKVDEPTEDINIKTSTPTSIPTATDKTKLQFVYEAIWSIDTPMNLKEKIWTYIGVPMPFQHLNFVSAIGEHVPLYYDIYNNNKLVKLDLISTIAAKEKYNGIPIINHYYAFRDFFNIQCLDNFVLLNKFSEQGGTINLYDADEFLQIVDNKVLLKDQNTQQLLYYGFFILFWPMMTFDVFQEYISLNKSISQLQKIYPELFPNTNTTKFTYEKENNLFESFYSLYTIPQKQSKKIFDELEKNLYIRIIKNNILNFSFGENKLTILSLRNLFDKFILNENFVSIKYKTIYNGQILILNKTYKNNREIELTIPFNSLLLRCHLLDKHLHNNHTKISLNVLDVYLYENGNYAVKCTWGETSNYTFNEAVQIAAEFVNKKIIDLINKLKNLVINQNYQLPHISPNVVKYSNINAEIHYRKNLSAKELSILKYIFQDFYSAKIFTSDLSNSSSDGFNYTYYLLKGNHQQDHTIISKKISSLMNTYEYLSKDAINTKWNLMYVHNKSVSIHLRKTDIRFSLHGLWDVEFNIMYTYILLIFYVLGINMTLKDSKYLQLIKKNDMGSSLIGKKNIKSLKQIDPALYDFKRYPGVSNRLIYSKICQKPKQPQILTYDEIKLLPEKEKEKIIKFWNFTTQSATYYYAPNPKYPYINFIVGKHPIGYCIPCAAKTANSVKDNTKKIIYDMCIKDHQYNKERKNIILDTRYIMNYGKNIDVGRLCKLPENTLEPLFYESFSDSNGIDEECFKEDRYYLIGIDQEWNGINKLGFLNILLMVLETSEQQLITDIKKKISDDPLLFNIILNGYILKYFYDYREFLTTITKIFLTKTLIDTYLLELPWNNIFIDILFYYFNITTIEFEDNKKTSSHGAIEKILDSAIEESLPGDNIEIFINHKTDIMITNPNSYKYIILLRKGDIVNPIFLANPIVYFKSKIINKKIFESTDTIVSILTKLLIYNKNEQNITNANEQNMTIANGKSNSNATFELQANGYYATLGTITEFINHHKQYSIFEYYVNGHNQCYYIGIKDTYGKNIYIPVVQTDWSPHKQINIINAPYTKYAEFKVLNEFLSKYNKWIVIHININKSNKSFVPGIKIEKWIAYGAYGKLPTKIFGFLYSGINYYFSPIAVLAAIKIKKVPIWQSYYDIGDINKQIYNQAPIKTDKLVSGISDGFYDHYLYQILIIEFTSLLSYEKNIQLRTSIKKNILGKKNMLELFNDISSTLDKYYDQLLKNTHDIKLTSDVVTTLKQQDYNSLVTVVNSATTSFTNKINIYTIIDQTIYNFDRMTINKFKTMESQEIKKELLAMSKKIVQFGNPPKTKEIPNILTACGTSTHPTYYCRGSKLIIPEVKFKKLLDILVSDIKNPLKEKWLFNPIFAENIINYLKFEIHPLESITVETE